MAQMKFAIMLWPTDKNFISVHSLDHIRQPRKPFNDYRFGEECLTVYPACKFPGPDGFSEQGESLWKTVILGIGGKKSNHESVCMSFYLGAPPVYPLKTGDMAGLIICMF